MKQTVQPNAGVVQKSAVELARSRTQQQPAAATDGRLTQLAAMMNGSAGSRALAQLKEDMQHGPQSNSVPTGQVVQCLMAGKTFLGRYKAVDTTNTRVKIGKLLTEYGSAWGYGYGYVSEYNGKFYRQERIRVLAELEQGIHQHFRDSGVARIKDAPESALMLQLLDETQAEHEKQIKELLAFQNELPVSEKGLSKKEKAEVAKTWQSIVGGTGNLKVTEKEKNKGTGLERDHAGFRVKALASIARLLQGPEGRKVVTEANKDGSDPSQHITIAPVSNKDHDVLEGRFWKQKKGTIPSSGWDVEALDQTKASPKTAKGSNPATYWDLDSDDDPIATYELASRRHKTKGDPDGVVLGKRQYLFNQGTGSMVNYIAEHKDSENRVMTTSGREGLSPTSVALGHELGHSLRYRKGASVSGWTEFLKLEGINPEAWVLWTHTDEELINITQVENRLLTEKGLEPRTFHKDYLESLEQLAYLRVNKYQKSPKHDGVKSAQIYRAIQGKKFNLAGRLLTAEGF